MSARFTKAIYCELCCVVMVKQGDRYCKDCLEEVVAWLYLAEQQEHDNIEEQEYIAQLEEKQANFYYDER